jgi:uncharacterized membrane protein affecting hemolysin expression
MRLFTRFFPKGWFTAIRTKLAVVITLLIGVISVFIFIYFPSELEEQAIKAIAAKAQSIIEMTAFSVGPALFFEDIQSIEEALAGARQNKDLVYIVVLNDSGRVIASFNKDNVDQADLILAKNNNQMSEDGNVYRVPEQ